MRPSVACRTAFASLAALAAASALHAQTARETVYFTTPNNKISRANLANGTSQTAVTDNGTNLKGLAARYDGNDVVTLLAANTTQGGSIRAYRCPSATAACQKLGVVAGLKQANAVALDTFGNAYAVNAQQGGADVLLYMPRKPSCPTTTGTGLPSGCFPGGYGAAKTIDSQVDGVTLVVDVKVASGSGDVYVLASKPTARLLRYDGAAVQSYIDNGGSQPTPSVVSSNFSGQEPAGLAIFPTSGAFPSYEIFVVTTQGSVYVFRSAGRNTFTRLNGQGQQVAIGVLGGATADPVTSGRVLVTVKGSNQVQSFGITRTGGVLVASPAVPDGSVPANVPFGVADASLSGSVYTPASATPLVVKLPTGHNVTFEKVNEGGQTEGGYYTVSEAAVRASAPSGSCPAGQALTLEGVTRCVPAHVRGFSKDGSTCLANGTGCSYLVFVADTGADVFGFTQEHHFDEDDFGFSTTCYQPPGPDVGMPFNSPDLGSYNPSLETGQPRVFQGTDDNDAVVVEGDLLADITTGCNSHIGRGGEFSMFVTGWDERSRRDIVDEKLDNLDTAITGPMPSLGGLDPHITAAIKPTLLAKLSAIQAAWVLDRVLPTLSAASATTTALNAFIAFVEANATTGFTACPGGGSCASADERNAPGELVSRAESARFFTCGAANGCYSTFP